MLDVFGWFWAFAVCLIVIAIYCISIAWARDAREWNGGKCACGQPWKQCGSEKGGRCYACFNPECDDHFIWIMTPWVDHGIRKNHLNHH